ncbi:MAG: porin family protein [Prevotellaceae bacterium]|jgi:opacity protein-like surface antigen|nr:porin family protein [Prevotellaceae bacterium]
MKKILPLLLLAFLATNLHAQTRAGDLTAGAKGAYISLYKNFTYGVDVSYQITDPLEVSLSGMLNPKIKKKDEYERRFDRDVALYSGSLDLRFYLLNLETFAMGPSLGGQCLVFKITDPSDHSVRDEGTSAGFNLGWHIRAELSENLKLNGGWRYTTATEGLSHHAFYLGIGYTFHLF